MPVTNLTLTAIAELDAIVEGAHAYGPDVAERTLDRFIHALNEIARGRSLGHTRTDLGFPGYIRFRNMRPLPFIVVYDDRTNVALRLIRGRALHQGTNLDDLDPA